MLVGSHAVQRAHRLALRAGGNYQHLVIFKFADFVSINENFLIKLDIAKLHRRVEVALHAATDDADLAVVF